MNSTTATYDALGRMVEKGLSGTYTQFVFRPSGAILAVYSSGLVKGTIPHPGGSTAVYNASGSNYIRHTDWLGSSRLATTWNHTVYSKEAYAPFGETYNEAGTADRSFTGQDQDVATGPGGTGVYDFLFRKYDPSAGRWLSPDPYGWGAVDQTTPQSLNRYAYVDNQPLSAIDLAGLAICVSSDDSWYDLGSDPCISGWTPQPNPPATPPPSCSGGNTVCVSANPPPPPAGNPFSQMCQVFGDCTSGVLSSPMLGALTPMSNPAAVAAKAAANPPGPPTPPPIPRPVPGPNPVPPQLPLGEIPEILPGASWGQRIGIAILNFVKGFGQNANDGLVVVYVNVNDPNAKYCGPNNPNCGG